MKETPSPEITRICLQVLSIALLIGGVLWILGPFVPAILWATLIVVTTWPLFQSVQRRLSNRRILAVIVMIGAILLVVILPCAIAIGSIVSNADHIAEWAKTVRQMDMPPPPSALGGVPLAGPRLVAAWQKVDLIMAEGLSKHLGPYSGALTSWFISKAGSVGMLMIHFLFTVIVATVLYAQGEAAAETTRAFCRRLAGARGEEVADLAAKAIRSVALGVVVTAVAQAAISGIGLAVSGTPSPLFLTAVIFILCLCQIGPMPILIPAIAWLYWRGDMASGTVLVVFAVITLPLDNLLRPILIRKGVDMPLLLVLLGVIGGLVTMGVIGLFTGPVILAVAHTLLKSWIYGDSADNAAARPA